MQGDADKGAVQEGPEEAAFKICTVVHLNITNMLMVK